MELIDIIIGMIMMMPPSPSLNKAVTQLLACFLPLQRSKKHIYNKGIVDELTQDRHNSSVFMVKYREFVTIPL